MNARMPRRLLLAGSLSVVATAGITSCIPSLGPRKRSVVNVGLITFPGGFQPSSVPLYKAALAVTKAHGDEFDINVNTISVTPPTPQPPSSTPPTRGGSPKRSEPPTVSALEQALNQNPPPDVVLFDTGYEFGYAIEKNLLQPIDTYLRADGSFKAEDYFSGAIKVSSDQGQLCGLPLAVQPTVIQYDKRLFDAAHLDPPDSTWTWTTLLNASKALTRPEGENGGQYALNLAYNSNVVPIFIWQNGGDVVSPDGKRALVAEAPAVEAIKFVYDLIHTYKVASAPPQKSSGGPSPASVAIARPVSGPGEAPPLFGIGGQRVAMQFASFNSFFGYNRFGPVTNERPIRLAELPRGKTQATMLDLNGILAMTQKASDPRAAFRVMALLAREMEKEMNVPAYRPAAANLTKLNPAIPADDAKVLIASLEYARAIPSIDQSIVNPLVFQKILQPILSGEQTPQEIARDAADAFDQALNA